MLKVRQWAAVLALPALAGGLALGLSAGPASAATPPAVNFVAPYNNSVGGMELDALGFGASGVNNPVVVWQRLAGNGHVAAGSAADFIPEAVSGGIQIVFAPGGVVDTYGGTQPAGLCVSTFNNVDGTHARLRSCAVNTTSTANPKAYFSGGQQFYYAGNAWQTFAQPPRSVDGAMYFQLVASGSNYLNAKGFGGNGTPVIVWSSTTGDNQIWTNTP